MELKTISGCFNMIDHAMTENVRCAGIESLEDIHNRLLEIGISDYIKNRVALLKVLSQINCIIDNYYAYEDEQSF